MQIKQIGVTDFKKLLGTGRVLLFNALKKDYHSCVIPGTIPYTVMKKVIKNMKEEDIVVVYCANYSCNLSHKFAEKKLGHLETVYIYSGGVFEWLLLQKKYGKKKYPSSEDCDIDNMQHREKIKKV
jgi:rhodanese-related sulfurtransferase